VPCFDKESNRGNNERPSLQGESSRFAESKLLTHRAIGGCALSGRESFLRVPGNGRRHKLKQLPRPALETGGSCIAFRRDIQGFQLTESMPGKTVLRSIGIDAYAFEARRQITQRTNKLPENSGFCFDNK